MGFLLIHLFSYDPRDMKIAKSDESYFTIVGGDQTGIFIHSVINPNQNQLVPGDQILAVSAATLQSTPDN